MSTNTVKGTLKDAEGAIQKKWGEVTNDPADIAVGAAKQGEGKAQKLAGKAEDKLK